MAFRFPTSGHYTFPSGTTGDVHEFLYTDPLNTDLTLPDATNTAREACWDTDDTPSTDVGPIDGPGGDGYIYLEASSPGGAGDQMHIEKEDQASLGNPLTFDASDNDIVVEFSTDQRGNDNDATAQIYTNENAAGWVARGTLFGGSGDPDKVATGGTNIIVNRSVDLTGLISHASTRIRITTELQGATVWHADYGISRIAIIGTDQISNEIDGITYDKDGSALGSCICTLYKDNGDDTISYWDRVTSHATTGAFTFADINSADASFFIVATKADTPDIVDVSERTIQPAVSYSGTVDLYLRSQVDKSETAGDGDLRLRSQEDKEAGGAEIVGAVTVAQSIAAAMVEGRVVAGDVTVAQTINAQMAEGRVLAGDVTVGQAIAAQMAAGRILAGDVTVGQAIAAQMLEGRVLAGDVTVSQAIAAALVFTGSATIVGDVTVGQAIAAQMLEGRVLAGDVTVSQAIGAQMLEGRVLAGDVTVGQAIAAQMLEGRVLAGDVTVSQAIAAQMLEGRVLAGDVTVSQAIGAQMLEGRVLAGDVTVGQAIAAAMTYSLSGTAEISGDIVVSQAIAALMLEGRVIAGEITVSQAIAAAMAYAGPAAAGGRPHDCGFLVSMNELMVP